MRVSKREGFIKLSIAAILVALIGLCIANPNEDLGSDCITSGQPAIIEDTQTPLAANVSKTTTKTTVKKSTKTKKLKKKAKKNKTSTKKKTKKSTSAKNYSSKTVKTQKTVVTTTKTITKKKSIKQKIQTTVKTTIRTTTTTKNTAPATNGAVKIRSLASKADSGVLTAFEQEGFKVVVDPKVSYSGVFRSAAKTIELKAANAVVYHELGHFVSYRTGRADSTSEFKAIFHEEKNSYTSSNKAYVTQSAGEYFAESFKNYTENPSKLKKERPKTYAYVESKVAQF